MGRAGLLLALVACGAPPAPVEPTPPPEVVADAPPTPPPEIRADLPVGKSPMTIVASRRDDALVWTDETGAIWTMPSRGGTPQQLSDQHHPGFAFRVFEAGDAILATTRGDVLRVDLRAGRVTPLGIRLPEYPESSVADGEFMY